MGFKDSYVPVFNAIRDTLSNLECLKQVNLGKNLKQIDNLNSLPVAIINTDLAKVTPSDGITGYQVQIPIILDVIIIEYEAPDWFEKMNTVMSEIVDAFLLNPTLGGQLQDLVWTSYAPGTISLQDCAYYGGEIRFMATLNYAAS
jgi:hypothetical protein